MQSLRYKTPNGEGLVFFSSAGVSSVELPSGAINISANAELSAGLKNAHLAANLLEAYFGGEIVTFDQVVLDLSGRSDFFLDVCNEVRKIPSGQVRTYGEVANAAGRKGSARAVGRVMASNPIPIIIPCHRVVASNGLLTGYTAPGGLEAKARFLEMEGIKVLPGGRVGL